MKPNVCLYLKKRCIKHNQLIQGKNYFPDGANGQFDNYDNINSDMDNLTIDNFLYFGKSASLQLEMNQTGTVIIEGDTLIELKPNQEYYITAYVYEAIDPIDIIVPVDYFINIAKTGWTDGTFTVLKSYQLKPGTEGQWQKIAAKLVTGTDKFGQIQLIQSGSYIPFVHGETFHIDSVSISLFIPYFGDKVTYHEEIVLPVKDDINATILYKIRDLTKPDFIFQRSRTRQVVIPSTQETERYFGFSHRTGSIRGEKSFQSEYMARLEVDGIEILNGLFTFDELTQLSCKEKDYKGKILSDNRTWLSLLENQTLCALDWTEYRSIFSLNKIQENWGVNGDTSPFILFPFERREIPVVVGDVYELQSNQLTVGLFIKPFIVKIFRHIGYEVEFKGTFLNSDFFRDLILVGAGVLTLVDFPEGFYNPEIRYIGYYTGSEVIQAYETETPDYENVEFDPLNYINGNSVEKVVDFELQMTLHFETWSGTVYSSPHGDASLTLPAISAYDGQTISVEAEFIFDLLADPSGNHVYWIEVRFYAGATLINTQKLYDPEEPAWFDDGFTIIQVVDEGDGNWRIDHEKDGDSFEHFFGASVMIGYGDAEFFAQLLKPADVNEIGAVMDIIPECDNTLDTYIRSIAMCFNLLHLTNENTKVISLMQRDDFYSLGSQAIDVEELAANEEITQIRLSERNAQNFLFSYKENSTDIWYKEFAVPKDFGNGLFKNSDGNKAIEPTEMTKDMIFNATWNWEPLVNMWLPRYQNAVDEQPNLGVRILHYDGLVPLDSPNEFKLKIMDYFASYVVVSNNYTEYPRATFASEVGFGTTNLAFHDHKGNLGLINKHWKKEMDIIANARLLSAYFYIKVEFIRKLDYSKYWKFQDVLFLLNAIVDFDYITPGVTKVELVPINTFYGTDTTC